MAVFYFDAGGHWVAFRRYEGDKFLFDKSGHWIGWFPWGDDDAVDRRGKYLGTIVRNRLLQRVSTRYRGYPGYPGYPGYGGYPGYPGFAGYFGYTSGFRDVPKDRLKH